jgi:hypothetical protein
MKYELKPLNVGGILDQAILILKDHFGLFLKITLCLQIPVGIALNLLITQKQPIPSPNATPEEMQAFLQTQFLFLFTVLMPLLLLMMVLVVPIMSAAIVHATACVYLGEPTSVGSAFRVGIERAVPLIWTWILVYFFTFVGLMLCILPGILMSFWFALATTVAVVERVFGVSALQRSRHLMRADWANHYLTFFLLGILMFFINAGIGAGSAFVFERHVASIVSVLLQAVTGTFGSIAMVVFYFSCRCRVENFDLMRLAEAVAAAPTEPAENLA